MLLTGLEPVCCIQQWILSPSCLPIPPQQPIKFLIGLSIIQKQMMGVEPTTSEWKSDILPLNYICKCGFYLSQTGHLPLFTIDRIVLWVYNADLNQTTNRSLSFTQVTFFHLLSQLSEISYRILQVYDNVNDK